MSWCVATEGGGAKVEKQRRLNREGGEIKDGFWGKCETGATEEEEEEEEEEEKERDWWGWKKWLEKRI